MPDSRRARRVSDPGLQPERTALAWFRTLLGYGALLALALRHSWYRAGVPFWTSLAVMMVVAFILWRYTLNRNIMDVTRCDFDEPRAVRDKFLIALAVLSLALLFAISHLRQLIFFLQGVL